ncbi:MAG: tail fiber domain-containing protein, partial [Candidatus Zixiibacteriota bacterium]
IADPLVEAIADSTGGAINLYNEISKYMGLEPCPFAPGGLLQMYDPIADVVKFEVVSTEDGAGVDIYDEIGKYMGLDPSPFTPGGLLRMYDPVADAVKFEVSSTEDGAGIDIYDEIGKYMGFDPTPFTPGGYLYMIESTGFVIDTNITMGSDGYIQVENGVTIGPNTNTGEHTLVMGEGTSASGNNSFAGGRHAQADHNNSFVWSDLPIGPSVVPLQTSSDNQFLVRSAGGIKFYTNANLTSGVELTPGSSSWSSITILDGIRNLRPVDGADILNKIEQLPINRYSFKSEDENVEHIGPMADDFHNLFGVGVDNQHIDMLDPSGIALAGIKELIKENKQLKNIVKELRDEIEKLKTKTN